MTLQNNNVQQNNQNNQNQKKPFYKKVWFWIVAVLISLVVVTSVSHNDDGPKSKNDKTEKVNKSSNKLSNNSNKQKLLEVGKTISFDGADFKVDQVKFLTPKDSGLASDETYVAVKVTIKNNSDNKLSYNPYDFKLNADGNETDMDDTVMLDNNEISNNDLKSGDLNKGATTSGWLVGKAKKQTKSLKLAYNGNVFDDEVKFSINLK